MRKGSGDITRDGGYIDKMSGNNNSNIIEGDSILINSMNMMNDEINGNYNNVDERIEEKIRVENRLNLKNGEEWVIEVLN